jgi:copper chaperone NosL
MTQMAAAVAAVLMAVACGGGVPSPARLDTNNDVCAVCRMVVSDQHLASQVLVPGEEPRFFDDLGCLARFLQEHPQQDAVVYVADHRTGEWTRAETALYSRIASTATPMASGLIAHATPESRAQDAAAATSVRVDAAVVLGGLAPQQGARR